MALTSGTKLGPYEILSPLGAGGMGEVYRARDTRLDRTVAIKILPSHLSDNPEARQRFDREARAISSLSHPNICTLYDVGHQNGMNYLVMEFLQGETLADRLMKGPLPPEQVLKYGIEICEGLEKAHRSGVVHRDLKPGNIMLTKTGAKLMDFGLAKTLSPEKPPSSGLTATLMSPAGSHPLTAQGTVVGTFQYMSPEQLEGKEADVRGDIFALGAVLYEMATGKRAFTGKSHASIVAAILASEPQPISAVQPMSPAALDRVVKTCLEKDPEERFQTAHDLKLQLKWISGGSGQKEVALVKKSSLLRWLAAAAILVIALVAIAGYVNLASRPTRVLRSSILPPAGASFLTLMPSSGPPVVSPDGTQLAFTARDNKSKVFLYVQRLNSLTAQPLIGTDNAMYPFWSPDSLEIGFFAEGKLKRISANGGPTQEICEAANGRGGAWSQSGVIVFTPSPTSPLLRVAATGGTPEPATKLDVSQGENSNRWPHFLPDGKHFVYWGRNFRGAEKQVLRVGTLGSLESKVLLSGTAMAAYASGYLLFMRDQTLVAQPFDAGRLRVTGEPVPLAEHVSVNSGTQAPIFSASQTGILIYQSGESTGAWDLVWFTRDGKQGGSVAQQASYYYPALSPDGTRLVVSLFNGTLGAASLWMFDLQRGTKTRLTFFPGVNINAVWGPDGKTVYYAANTSGVPHIYAKAADGSGPEQSVLESSDVQEIPASLSPDGRYLAYVRRSASSGLTGGAIWALPLFGDRKPFPVVQTRFDENLPSVSPNGKWTAYQSNETGGTEVYITAFPRSGAKWQVSTSGGTDSRWRRDGKELFFLDLSDNVVAVDVDTTGSVIRLGVPHILFQAPGIQRQAGSYDVSADGKKFLVNRGNLKEGSEPLTMVQNWTAELKK